MQLVLFHSHYSLPAMSCLAFLDGPPSSFFDMSSLPEPWSRTDSRSSESSFAQLSLEAEAMPGPPAQFTDWESAHAPVSYPSSSFQGSIYHSSFAGAPPSPPPYVDPLPPPPAPIERLHRLLTPPAVPVSEYHTNSLWLRLVRLLVVGGDPFGGPLADLQSSMWEQHPGDRSPVLRKVLRLDVPCREPDGTRPSTPSTASPPPSSTHHSPPSPPQHQPAAGSTPERESCICYVCWRRQRDAALGLGGNASSSGDDWLSDEFLFANRRREGGATKLLLLSFNDDNLQLAQRYIAAIKGDALNRRCQLYQNLYEDAETNSALLSCATHDDALLFHGDVPAAPHYKLLAERAAQLQQRHGHSAPPHQHILVTSRYPDHRAPRLAEYQPKMDARGVWVQEWFECGFWVVDLDAPDPWSYVFGRHLTMIDVVPATLDSYEQGHPHHISWNKRSQCCKAVGCGVKFSRLIGDSRNSKKLKHNWIERHLREGAHEQLDEASQALEGLQPAATTDAASSRGKRGSSNSQRSRAANRKLRREVTAVVSSSQEIAAEELVQRLAEDQDVRQAVIGPLRAADADHHSQPFNLTATRTLPPTQVSAPHIRVHVSINHPLPPVRLLVETVIHAPVLDLLRLLSQQLGSALPPASELVGLQLSGRVQWLLFPLETGQAVQAQYSDWGGLDIGTQALAPIAFAANFLLLVQIDVSGTRRVRKRRDRDEDDHGSGGSDGKEEKDDSEDDHSQPFNRHRSHSQYSFGGAGSSSSSGSSASSAASSPRGSTYALSSPLSPGSPFIRNLRLWLLCALSSERNASWVDTLDEGRLVELRQQLLAACLLDEETAEQTEPALPPQSRLPRSQSESALPATGGPALESAPVVLLYSREHYVRQRLLQLLRPPSGEPLAWVTALDSGKVALLVRQLEKAEMEELQSVWLPSDRSHSLSAAVRDADLKPWAGEDATADDRKAEVEEVAAETAGAPESDEEEYVLIPTDSRSATAPHRASPLEKAQRHFSRMGAELPLARRLIRGKLALSATMDRLHSDLVRVAEQFTNPLVQLTAPAVAHSGLSQKKDVRGETVTRQ